MKVYGASPSDIEQLMDLFTEFWAESGYSFNRELARSAFLRLLNSPELGKVWLAENDEKPAGYIVLALSFSLEFFGKTGFIEDLFVKPGARGVGVGRKLLQVLIEECERRNIKALQVEVGGSNHEALALYRSEGLQDTDRTLLARRFET